MSRRIASIAVLGLLLIGGGTQAAAAPALLPQIVPPRLLSEVGKPVPPRPLFNSGFTASASGGYKVKVFTFGSAVILEVVRRDRRHFSAAVYLARGVAAPQRLQATFGDFGKVSMRFRPAKNGSQSLCRFGERLSRRHGTYVGELDFKGEGGYVAIDLHRAKGSIVTPAGRCPHSRHHLTRAEAERAIEALLEPISGLEASARDGVATTRFLGIRRKTGTAFLASHEETHGKLAIVRVAIVRGGKGFHVNEAVTAAGVSPPPPFHGTGRYHAEPDGTTTWSGALSVDFPGAPRFPLTGPEFEALIDVPF